MLHIAKTEWLKIKKYPAFWWVMAITALTYPGVNYIFYGAYKDIAGRQTAAGKIVKALLGNPFIFPEAWRSIAYFSSIFVFIPAIVVIMLITNEYTYKTNRQNIIDGWSRTNFMTGKFVDVLILSLIVTLMYTIMALIMGFTNTPADVQDRWKLSYYVGLFALQTFSQLSLAFMTGLLVRKSFIALAIFAFYYIIAEPIAVNVLYYKYKSNIGEYFPLEISDKLLPKPAFLGRIDMDAYNIALQAVHYHVWYTLVWTIVIWVFCFWLYKKRDL